MTPKDLSATLSFLRFRAGGSRRPRVALVLGSGLGAVAEGVSQPVRIPYADVPGFGRSTVAGHAGALIFGELGGVEVAVMAGRFHLYEGLPPGAVALPLRVLAELGVEQVVLTNAAGAVNRLLRVGQLMLIADHLDLTFRDPLAGPSPALPSSLSRCDVYDVRLRELALETATSQRIPFVEGVYAAVTGPSFETPAEIEMLRRLGADAVGMSTVPEALAARSVGLRVLAISCITNAAAGAGGGKLSHDEVLQVGAEAGVRLGQLLRALVPLIGKTPPPSSA